MAKKQVDLDRILNPNVPATDRGVPSLTGSASAANPMEGMRVRIVKFNLNDQTEIAELEKLETRAIRGEGVYILSQKDFVFMDNMFIMVKYLEDDDVVQPPPTSPAITRG